MCPLLVTVITMLVLYPIYPPIRKAAHWIFVIVVTVGIIKFDINDCVSLTLPDPTIYDNSNNILLSSPIMYSVSRPTLVDEGFSADTVLLKIQFYEVGEIVTHSFVTFDDKSAVFVINCIIYREGLGKTVTF